MGYSIHNQFSKRGYGKEAVSEAIKIGFEVLNYHRIEAHINIDNFPSMKLAESVGMQFECVRKGFIFENGEWTDHRVYVINSSDSQ
ncbi:MAG TPA: GNAT family protein [Candidatus Bathyarchaeia archaeon]|nr:GNAT family protein [Candidatus Bathyarchaeia archaeon]